MGDRGKDAADSEISAHLGTRKHEGDYGVVVTKSKHPGGLSLGQGADSATESLCNSALQLTAGKQADVCNGRGTRPGVAYYYHAYYQRIWLPSTLLGS